MKRNSCITFGSIDDWNNAVFELSVSFDYEVICEKKGVNRYERLNGSSEKLNLVVYMEPEEFKKMFPEIAARALTIQENK